MSFLYEQLNNARSVGMKWPEVPDFVLKNLNQQFEIREYQKEAFGRFIHCSGKSFENKEYPLHFLYNMATGSGKTLIMAGLILYLYKQGYRNFLFFVNSSNIIKKTEDNFLNNVSSKYLFNDTIIFDNKQVNIRQVDNFEDINLHDINICFTTIQKLHSDLTTEKEDSITFSDFKNKKVVLLSDEAHHGQVQTREGELFEKPNWENTVEKIFKQNSGNILFEFTATMDFINREIVEKYRNKVIYKYDLKEFRNDGFSKDPELLSSNTDKKDRIIQAIVLSQYRQEVAVKHNINLKPVILFKAQKTIEQSNENKALFHKIISELSIRDIESVRSRSNIRVIQRAFSFFKERKITDIVLVQKFKDSFAENKCLSVNDEAEKEANQLLVNSLEDKDNRIRAIFAVQKLNEGWDVLNLFDIVRLYEGRDGKNNRPGKTTISEAQLIGRGARYFPFSFENRDRFKRKFDKNLDNELRILEELHYHSNDEHRYISEIKLALKEVGMWDEDEIELDLKLKDEFKKKKFYQSGLVYTNEWQKRDFEKVTCIEDLGVSKKNIVFSILSGQGDETGVFTDEDLSKKPISKNLKDLKIKDIDTHIIKNAITKSDFYNFDNIKHFFPKVTSLDEFIKTFLGGLSITFEGLKKDLQDINNETRFYAILKLLNEIEQQIKGSVTEYIGTEEFKPKEFKLVFTDKKIKVKKGNERADGQESQLAEKDWYVFNANYGTSEEKSFVNFVERKIADLKKDYKEIYLVRNERQLKIYNFKDGQAFEPDYLLFLVEKDGRNITYQLFIEPKGTQLIEYDKWKSDFLEEITKRFKDKTFKWNKTKKYKVLGVPFYTSDYENEFNQRFIETL